MAKIIAVFELFTKSSHFWRALEDKYCGIWFKEHTGLFLALDLLPAAAVIVSSRGRWCVPVLPLLSGLQNSGYWLFTEQWVTRSFVFRRGIRRCFWTAESQSESSCDSDSDRSPCRMSSLSRDNERVHGVAIFTTATAGAHCPERPVAVVVNIQTAFNTWFGSFSSALLERGCTIWTGRKNYQHHNGKFILLFTSQ